MKGSKSSRCATMKSTHSSLIRASASQDVNYILYTCINETSPACTSEPRAACTNEALAL